MSSFTHRTLTCAAVWGDEIRGLIHKYFDNSLDNIGRYNSFTWWVNSMM